MDEMKRLVLLILMLIGAKATFSQQNAIKIGVLGTVIGDYSFGIEQVMHSNYSVNVDVGYWDLNASIVDLHNFFQQGQDVWLQKGGAGWHGSIEMRTYFGLSPQAKNKSFYYGPYFRFWNNSLLLNDYINNEEVNQQLFDVNAVFKGVGVGLQLGYHWMLNDKFWIDFYFIGLGAEHITMKAEYRVVGTQEFQYSFIENDVKEAFADERRFSKKNLQVWSGTDALYVKLPVWLPGIRSGLNLAYSF